MTLQPIRKVQMTCFLLAHIPLAASVAFFAMRDGPMGALLAVAFPATVLTAVLLVGYVGRAFAATVERSPRSYPLEAE